VRIKPQIKYLRVPDTLLDAVKEEQARAREVGRSARGAGPGTRGTPPLSLRVPLFLHALLILIRPLIAFLFFFLLCFYIYIPSSITSVVTSTPPFFDSTTHVPTTLRQTSTGGRGLPTRGRGNARGTGPRGARGRGRG
ncbi:hypothetical protein L210DRAFT_3453348, partial [Boletus edulis BED1]